MTGRLVLLVAIVGTIGCDRVSKHIVTRELADMPARSYLGDTVWLGYVENPGGFLSLGAGLPPAARTFVFTGATGVMLAVFTFVAVRSRWSGRRAIGAALFVAGGAANWIDRAVSGSVVDFLSVGIGPLRTGVFNVADVAIMLGALVLVLDEFLATRAGVSAEP
jgi:signal peptidase II